MPLMLDDRGFIDIPQNPDPGRTRIGHTTEQVTPPITAILWRKIQPTPAETDAWLTRYHHRRNNHSD